VLLAPAGQRGKISRKQSLRAPTLLPRQAMHFRRLRYVLESLCLLAALTAIEATRDAASAHPHVWATIRSEVIYASDGSVTAVRHSWTFDDMFSAFATTGMPKTNGTFTRQTLQPLAQVNVESLKEFAYFTYAKADGKRLKDPFIDPTGDYWLDYDAKATVLTLHFTLPFRNPVKAKSLQIEVYDPEFFIDFGFAKVKPATLVGAPAGCTLSTDKPTDANFPVEFFKLDQNFATSEANIGMGASFANKIMVMCP
jgi:ABC-type uncharacterized transport system substrate-binding protein